MLKVIATGVVFTSFAMGLAGGAQADPPAGKAAKARDPNEIVCEKQEVTGSRLGSKKVCMTRAQWQEQRLQDRMTIDRAQLSPTVKGE